MQCIELYIKYMPQCKLTYTPHIAVVDLHLPVEVNKCLCQEERYLTGRPVRAPLREGLVKCFPGELSSGNSPLLASRS